MQNNYFDFEDSMAIIITLDARGYCARSKVTRLVPLAILITLTSAIIYLKIIIFKNVLKYIYENSIMSSDLK